MRAWRRCSRAAGCAGSRARPRWSSSGACSATCASARPPPPSSRSSSRRRSSALTSSTRARGPVRSPRSRRSAQSSAPRRLPHETPPARPDPDLGRLDCRSRLHGAERAELALGDRAHLHPAARGARAVRALHLDDRTAAGLATLTVRRSVAARNAASEAVARGRAHEAGGRTRLRDLLRPSRPPDPALARDRERPSRANRPNRRSGDAWSLVGAPTPGPPRAERPIRSGDQGSRTALRRRRTCETVTMELSEVGRISNRVLDEVETVVVGKRDALELLMLGLLADGHVLIEDYPGLAKTLMARSFAQVMSMDFSRIQFTPDLMPSDVTGSSVYNQRESDFEFRAGPIFANLLLADEINRAPPKTQAALLEAMQERQVTSEGETHRLGPPFIVLATQNPIEYEGTYPLPEAQLDRFLLRMSVGYPSREDEWQMLANRAERGTDEVQLSPVVDRDTLLDMQAAVEGVHVSEAVGLYMIDIASATRDTQSIQVGASPRGSLALLKLSRSRAALQGRDFVTPDDVKSVAVPALAHRLTLRPELWVQRVSAEDVVRERLDTVPTPAAEDLAAPRA